MSDKPLDCVGIDLASQRVGKHDFRIADSTTTNAIEQPLLPASQIIDNAVKAMQSLPLIEDEPHRMNVGKDYWETMNRWLSKAPTPQKMFPPLLGFNFFLDESLEPDVAQVVNRDGKVLQTYRLKP